MTPIRALLGCAVAAAALASGCSAKHPPKDVLGAKEAAALANMPGAALDLREFQVASTEGGSRGVFLKLTRLPNAVSSTSQSGPARIIVDIQGPTGEESPEEVFPGGDTLVTHVSVSRQEGWLRVILDLEGDDAPDYAVYPMADWVVVRIKSANVQPRPWAHRM